MIVPSIFHYDIPDISNGVGLDPTSPSGPLGRPPHVAPRAAGLFAGHEAFGTTEGALNLGNEAARRRPKNGGNMGVYTVLTLRCMLR